MRKILASLAILTLAIGVLVGCGGNESTGGQSEGSGESSGETIEKFVMAYLPLEGAEGVQTSNQEFEESLSEAIGLPVEAHNVTNYNSAIEAMKSKKADMVVIPPFAYVLGVERANIEAIAGAKQTPGLQSVIIVPKDSDIESFEDLKGKTFGFVDPASASGHLIPKTMIMNELGLTVEELENEFLGDIQFAGTQESVVIGLVNGQYDAAAAGSPILGLLEDKGLIEKDSYRIIAESEEAPPTPVAIRADIPEDIKKKVKDFLLTYENAPEFLANGWGMKNAEFVDVSDSDYDFYRNIAETLGMSPEELLGN